VVVGLKQYVKPIVAERTMMKTVKEILSIAILIMSIIMVVATWDQLGNTGWLIAVVGWLEIVVNQRKETNNDLS
jgi:uncharacterized membrane protein